MLKSLHRTSEKSPLSSESLLNEGLYSYLQKKIVHLQQFSPPSFSLNVCKYSSDWIYWSYFLQEYWIFGDVNEKWIWDAPLQGEILILVAVVKSWRAKLMLHEHLLCLWSEISRVAQISYIWEDLLETTEHLKNRYHSWMANLYEKIANCL